MDVGHDLHELVDYLALDFSSLGTLELHRAIPHDEVLGLYRLKGCRAVDVTVRVLFLAVLSQWYLLDDDAKASLEGCKTIGADELLPCTHLLTWLSWISIRNEAYTMSMRLEQGELLSLPCAA